MDILDTHIGALSLKDDARRLLDKINEKLINFENCKKWFKEYGPFSTDTLEKVLKICTFEAKSANESDLKYTAIETIAKKCIVAKIELEKGEKSEALTAVQVTKKLMAECKQKEYFLDAYAVGFEYVIRCLEIEIDIKDKEISVEKLENILETLQRYETFDVPNKVAVLAMEQYFVDTILRHTRDHDIQIGIIKKMIEMDPTNLEWRYSLYTLYYYKRTQISSREAPTSDEKEAIITAFNMSTDKWYLPIRLGYIACLAETLKSEQGSDSEIQFDGMAFGSARNRIRKEATKILELEPDSVNSYIEIAKVYCSTLPPKCRDFEFATYCIEQALRLCPTSSKANHRRGLLYLSSKNFDKAILHLERSKDKDLYKKRAIIDLIKTYLSDVSKYQAELRDLFDKLLEDTDRSEHAKEAEYYYLKAIFHFFMKEFELGVKFLIEAYNKDKYIIKNEFERVYRDKKRFLWKDNSFIEEQFRNQLLKSSGKASSENEKTILEHYLSALKTARKPRR